MRLNRMNAPAACCHFSIFIGSFLYKRAKPPQGTVLFINLLGKGLIPRACVGDGGSMWWAPDFDYTIRRSSHEYSSWKVSLQCRCCIGILTALLCFLGEAKSLILHWKLKLLHANVATILSSPLQTSNRKVKCFQVPIDRASMCRPWRNPLV